MFKKITTTAFLMFLLIGCGGGNNDLSNNKNLKETTQTNNKTLKETIETLEASGELPILDRSSDIGGPDLNNNGVRDDIEDYINKHYSDEKQKKALMQYAKYSRNELLTDTSNMIAVKEANRHRSRAMHCIFLVFNESKGTENPTRAWKKISSMTANTKARLKADLAFDKALDGTSWSLPEGDTCE